MTEFVDDIVKRAAARDWIVGRTLWEIVERRAAKTPDGLLARDEEDRTMTFSDYLHGCEIAAAGLSQQYGVGEGTSVSWSLPTWLESFVLVGALSRLSAHQNPIIPIYREREGRVRGQPDGCRADRHPVGLARIRLRGDGTVDRSRAPGDRGAHL